MCRRARRTANTTQREPHGQRYGAGKNDRSAAVPVPCTAVPSLSPPTTFPTARTSAARTRPPTVRVRRPTADDENRRRRRRPPPEGFRCRNSDAVTPAAATMTSRCRDPRRITLFVASPVFIYLFRTRRSRRRYDVSVSARLTQKANALLVVVVVVNGRSRFLSFPANSVLRRSMIDDKIDRGILGTAVPPKTASCARVRGAVVVTNTTCTCTPNTTRFYSIINENNMKIVN